MADGRPHRGCPYRGHCSLAASFAILQVVVSAKRRIVRYSRATAARLQPLRAGCTAAGRPLPSLRAERNLNEPAADVNASCTHLVSHPVDRRYDSRPAGGK